MIVVSDISTPRLHYVLDYVFNMRLGIGYELQTEDVAASQPAIYYTTTPTVGKFSVPSGGLLSESDIWQFVPDLKFDNGLPIIFADNSGCTFTFDVFSAIFWMLSRYEEYLPFLPDEHGRFTPSESFLWRNGLLCNPVVDRWIMLFRDRLQKQFPQLVIKTETFEFQPTIDIDSPWSYLHKGLVRNVGGLLRDVSKLRFGAVVERILVLLRLKRDPFFTFDFINQIHAGLPLTYFVLIAEHGRYDKSVSPHSKAFRRFVAQLASTHTVGLHPSYAASDNEQRFATEKQQFESIAGVECHSSRQHFLRIVLPKYYQMLNRLKISTDYSFGYADNVGFRAGTSRRFRFFDLQNNTATDVVMQPLVAMDVTLRNYMNLTPQQASEQLSSLIETIRQTNGTFTTLWHNQHFRQTDKWQPWDAVYLEMLGKAGKV